MIKYLKYLIVHKYYVFIECWKSGLYVHAFTHDLSKFRPSEFIPYARWFYGSAKRPYYEKKMAEKAFNRAWKLHCQRNKHHWKHWVDEDNRAHMMPTKYIKQMICDWKGMSRTFGDTWQDYYYKNRNTMNLHIGTVSYLDAMAGHDD